MAHSTRRTFAVLAILVSATAGVFVILGLMADARRSDESAFDAHMRRLVGVELRGRTHTVFAGAPDSLIATVREFYRARRNAPAWIEVTGPSQRARDLAALLSAAGDRGLDPERYGVSRIIGLVDLLQDGWDRRTPPRTSSELDLRLTVAFLRYAQDEAGPGRSLPRAAWLATLEAAVTQDDPSAVLDAVGPQDEQYSELVTTLARYRALAREGGWTRLPSGCILGLGDRGQRVALLKARLMESGDLEVTDAPIDPVFDEATAAALERFQGRCGLQTTGTLAPVDVAVLNLPISSSIRDVQARLADLRSKSGTEASRPSGASRVAYAAQTF